MMMMDQIVMMMDWDTFLDEKGLDPLPDHISHLTPTQTPELIDDAIHHQRSGLVRVFTIRDQDWSESLQLVHFGRVVVLLCCSKQFAVNTRTNSY